MTINITTEHQAALGQAETALAGISEVITKKRADLATAEAERERLDNLILTRGDSDAMLSIVGIRSTIDGLKTHLSDLQRAEVSAKERRDLAESDLLEAKINARDMDGAMSDEEIRTAALKVAQQVDKITHPFFAKIDAHNQAGKELTALGRKMHALRNENVDWSYTAIPHVSSSSIHAQHITKSHDRYAAPQHQALHLERMKQVQQDADFQREELMN